MTVCLQRYNWDTTAMERRPVNETVLQEMVDTLFARNPRWKADPEWFDRQLRNWQQRIDVVPAQAPEPPKRPTTAYQQFVKDSGLPLAEAAKAWRARKAVA